MVGTLVSKTVPLGVANFSIAPPPIDMGFPSYKTFLAYTGFGWPGVPAMHNVSDDVCYLTCVCLFIMRYIIWSALAKSTVERSVVTFIYSVGILFLNWFSSFFSPPGKLLWFFKDLFEKRSLGGFTFGLLPIMRFGCFGFFLFSFILNFLHFNFL